MRRKLMDILVCPTCKEQLTLDVKEELDGEIFEGSLSCKSCDVVYPIENTIPNMLPPSLRD